MATSVGVTVAGSVAAQEPPAEPAPPSEPPAPPPAVPAEPPKQEAPPEKVTLEETPDEPPKPPPAAPPKKRTQRPEKVTLEETPEPAPVPARRRTAKPPPPRREEAPSAVEPEPSAERAEQKPEEAEPAPKKDDDNGNGLLGPFRIGPIVGVGLPGIVSFGGMIKLTRYFGAGINIGLIPTVRISFYGEAELSYQEYDAYGRIFPFGGMLFVGAGVGYATMNGHVRASYDTTAYQNQVPGGLPNPIFIDSEGSVKTLVLTPTIGLLHTFKSGFTIGLDVGAQVPIAPSETHFQTKVPPSTPQTVINQYVTPNDKKVQDTLDTVGKTILPTFNLRIGWLL